MRDTPRWGRGAKDWGATWIGGGPYTGLKTAADYMGPLTELTTAKGFKPTQDPYEFPLGSQTLVRGDFTKNRGSLAMCQSSLVMLK